ncbi:M15 family metallopeptidase [Streptomyces sp. CA-278952]|uniref:M15 family metallopeptidase n=1 Tax=unclassified Streptomyces TaxID=2593676 RepID=UPI0022427A21|nr:MULTISPECIES: M15 family metallopeptidase [unclassified Streptomyces]UZI26758.1 M15 family metallopeptidase [Streptomyces sp. VB1]WDG26942.1 M15 family metallopeptidase [Streptomyces sp. CA-278952]
MAAIAAALGHALLNPTHAPSTSASPRSPSAAPSSAPASLPPPLHRELRGALGAADGAVPDGVTVLDDGIPAVANLDADLLAALRRAAGEAAREGVEFAVNSGWRSPEYQNQLLRKAIARYGSEAEAARWVATATTSPHVSGEAVDIGPDDATEWLSEHGAAYGLCQTYRNEPWHYELRTEAIDRGCPRMYADPTQDPRMRQ